MPSFIYLSAFTSGKIWNTQLHDVTWLAVQIVPVAIYLIILEACMDILLVINVNVLMLNK